MALTIALQALAGVYFVRQELPKQLSISRRRLALSRDPRFDDVHQQITILDNLSNVLIQAGEYNQALSYLLETEQLASEMNLEDQEMSSLSYQAECLYRLDRWQELLAVDERRQAIERRYARDMIAQSCTGTAYTARCLCSAW